MCHPNDSCSSLLRDFKARLLSGRASETGCKVSRDVEPILLKVFFYNAE